MRNTLLETKPITPGTCEWCGKDCDPTDNACSLSCEAQLRRLETSQGQMVLRELKFWRKSPNHAARNEAIAKIVPMVDTFLRNDRLRREELGAARRRKAAEEAAKAKAPAAPEAAPTASQTAAPLIDQPEDQQ